MNSANATATPAFCLVQITDCHLGASPGSSLLGMDTDHSLDEVLALVERQHPHIDMLVVSGDLSGDSSAAAYQRLLPKLEGLADTIVWLPGNHDEPATMHQCAGEALMPKQATLGNWQLLFLNSAVSGQVGGHLAESELALCRQHPCDSNTLIFVHHHLNELGAEWLDEQLIDNADALFDILDDKPGVAAIVSGHVHQASAQRHRQQRLLTTPSTCIQFAPGSRDFALDDLNPGYRWFTLHTDGNWQTGVERVSGVEFTVDKTANGYE